MKKDFLSIRILHGALVFGCLVFFAVVYFVLGTEEGAPEGGDAFDMFFYLIPVVIVASILVAKMLDKNRLAAYDGKGSLKDKLENYRARVIIRCALVEGAALFAVVALLLTGNNIYALYFGIGWLALIYFRPYAGEFSRDYNLSVQEEQELHQE